MLETRGRDHMGSAIEIKRKICLIGDGGVGKTSLIKRFVLDQFDDKYLATFGTKVTKKSVEVKKGNDNIILNLLIWDVMGQEEFKKAQAHAYDSAKGAFVVFDISRRSTFESVSSWCKDLFNVTKEVPIIILANKCDLQEEAEVQLEDLDKLAKELKAQYILTSAKTGENVKSAFIKISKKLL